MVCQNTRPCSYLIGVRDLKTIGQGFSLVHWSIEQVTRIDMKSILDMCCVRITYGGSLHWTKAKSKIILLNYVINDGLFQDFKLLGNMMN